jgi:hypothetical protein
MSATVLYYPNVTLASPRPINQSQDYEKTDTNLLKTALLLWDAVEIIVPYGEFSVPRYIAEEQRDEERDIDRAFEQVVRPRVVTDSEKEEVHKVVEKLVKNEMPNWLIFEPRVDNFNMYPNKLLPKTWELLCDAHVAEPGSDPGGEHYGLQRSLGLILMNIIADVCSGKTKEKITNYVDAHDACARLCAAQNGGELENHQPSAAHKHLVSISLKGANVNDVSLSNLVRLRERESEDGFLPGLRENYRKYVDEYINRLKQVSKPQDVAEIEAEFEKSTIKDFQHLNQMLRLQAGGVVIGSVVVASLTFALSGGNPLVVAAGMAASIPAFRLTRQNALESHKTSWLYRVSSPIQPY